MGLNSRLARSSMGSSGPCGMLALPFTWAASKVSSSLCAHGSHPIRRRGEETAGGGGGGHVGGGKWRYFVILPLPMHRMLHPHHTTSCSNGCTDIASSAAMSTCFFFFFFYRGDALRARRQQIATME